MWNFYSMFADETRAEELIERICRRVQRDLRDALRRLFGVWPNGDVGLARLDRLVGLGTGFGLGDQLESVPELAGLFASTLCTSGAVSDSLIQNPELASLLFDPDVLSRVRTKMDVVTEGRRLLEKAGSYSHQLDRLRFLKQEHTILISAQDVGNLFEQPLIWRGISDLAEGILELLIPVVWRQFESQLKGSGEPVSVAVLGKLGGRELNYSSDIDLLFVGGESLGEDGARRFCELFRAAVADRMGRGDLYRVDLRLRPFGAQGPIISSWETIDRYYSQYAEPWEQAALIRSFLIGSAGDQERWESLRMRTVFSGRRSEMALANLLKMRKGAEAVAAANDLKRGWGGIRDVELCIQVLQMLQGDEHEGLRGRSTVEMLEEAVRLEILDRDRGGKLIDHYTLLRKVEHRAQMMGNRQVYGVPEDEVAREVLAYSLGYERAALLEDELLVRRREVRQIFDELFAPYLESIESARVHSWLAPEFGSLLAENEGSLGRIQAINDLAPALIEGLKKSPGILEQVISGEIEEVEDPKARFDSLRRVYDRAGFDRAVRSGWVRAGARAVLVDGAYVGRELTAHTDEAIRVFSEHFHFASFCGLGSFAAGEMSLTSDADLLVIVETEEEAMAADRVLKSTLIELGKLKQLGMPLSIDFRLRPEGRNGRLVVTEDSLRRYSATFMEPWERFALGRARAVCGHLDSVWVLDEIVYEDQLSKEHFESLLHMKGRIERERVQTRYRERHIKLGAGGLDDVNWMLQLAMLVYSRHLQVGEVPLSVEDRLQFAVSHEVLDVVEAEAVRVGHAYLIEARNRVYLCGVGDDVFPENPDRLMMLGAGFGFNGANAMLEHHFRITRRIRDIFDSTIERLRGEF
jgi:glutamate-ammonia-ligase adenylyltransferase